MKLKEIKNIQWTVKDVLENDIQSRNSDNYLYVRVIERVCPEAACAPFRAVFLNQYKVPSYETVSRTRRKLQEKYSELRADINVALERYDNEDVFKEYGRENI